MLKKLKLGNKGLSLLELLVAIAILAVVVSPLLGSLVSSARLAKKGRDMADITNAGQSAMEVIQSTPVASLVAGLAGGGAPFGAGVSSRFFSLEDEKYTALADTPEAGGDEYYIGLSGLRSSGGGQAYDALVTLTAVGTAASGPNAVEITQYSPMDAVFTQPAGDMSNPENPDIIAAINLSADAVMRTGLDDVYTPHYFFEQGMNRVIDIRVLKNEERVEITATATYRYYADILHNGETVRLEYTSPEYRFFDGKYSATESSLKALYFFYYPNYNHGATGAATDIINIYNNFAPEEPGAGRTNLGFNVFLVKQKATDLMLALNIDMTLAEAEARLSAMETDYTATINLYQNPGVADPTAMLYSNIGTNIFSGLPTPQPTAYQYAGLYWRINKAVDSKLVATKVENRMYSATVTLLESGTLAGGAFTLPDDRLLTFEGIKLN